MNKSKFCSFYVSDVHLVTMLLPYINEKIKEKNEFITVFEKDISESAEKVIKSVFLSKEKALNFLNIGWKKKNNLRGINIKGKYLIVMGSTEYIEKINREIEEKNVDCIVINCFEVFQAEKIIDTIIENHEKLINSKGENDIWKIFTQCTKKNNKKITIIE